MTTDIRRNNSEQTGHALIVGQPTIVATCGLVMALGLLLLAFANNASVHGGGGYWLFWGGILAIIVPAIYRLVGARVVRGERVTILVMESTFLYLAKVVREPTSFSFSDEFAHWRDAENALRLGHLFSFNPLIPTVAEYPGLTDVTVGLCRLTGLSVFISGTIIIGVARLVLCLALFFVLERLAGSRVASVGSLIYFTDPNFLYWSAQFAYESLAVPLLFFVIWLVLCTGDDNRRTAWLIACLGGISALIITHHVASYALAIILWAWTLIGSLSHRRTGCYVPLGLTIYATVGAAAWLAFVAPITIHYLGPVFGRTISGALALFLHHSPTRQLFAANGKVAPSWEQGIAVVAVGMLVIALPFGILAIRRQPNRRPLLFTLILGCLLYLALLPLRLTAGGQETANRSSEYVFLSLGLVDATVVVKLAGFRMSGLRQGLASALLTVVFLGGVAVSWAFYERLQPDFSISGEPTQPIPAATALAWWMEKNVGAGHRIGADLVDDLPLGSYGEQSPVFSIAGEQGDPHIWQVFFPTAVNIIVRNEINADHLQYLITDDRLIEGPQPTSGYFDPGEPPLPNEKLSMSSLSKFDGLSRFSRLYDSGSIVLYQVGS